MLMSGVYYFLLKDKGTINKKGAVIMEDESKRKLRQLRVEVGKRATDFDARSNISFQKASDDDYVRQKGTEISRLFREGDIENAWKILEEELTNRPSELRFLNLKTLFSLVTGPVGDFGPVLQHAARTIELAEEQGSLYYAQATLTNLGIVARDKGEPELSLSLFLAAHLIDLAGQRPFQLQPLQNLVGYYARHGMSEKAFVWLKRTFNAAEEEFGCPWHEIADVIEWCKKDTDLARLRGGKSIGEGYPPFLELMKQVGSIKR
jgi:hypothetical protein